MEGFLETVARVNDWVNSNIAWGVPMLILLVGTGVYLTIRTGAFQFAKFGHAMKNTIGKIGEKQVATDKGSITPFQAVTTALAATVGTGNIAGVAGAIAAGGPGAVFWMWVSALFGMATKYAEVVLAVRYRERNVKGDWVGGPMYYISNGLGKNWKLLAVIFCVFGGLASFGIGNIAQINTIAGSVFGAINTVSAGAAAASETVIKTLIGIVIAFIVALVAIGGVRRIGQVTEKLVPFMSVLYIIGSLVIIFANIGNIGPALGSIFKGAFNPQAVVGGIVGVSIRTAMTKGVARGCFSNEAGLGSAPIAHAATSLKNPVKQGLYGIFEVFVDTIVICTLTALTILISGIAIPYGGSAGAELTTAAFTTTFAGWLPSVFVAIAILLFATSTILSWSLYGARCAEYLFGPKSILPYQVLFVIVVVLGSTMELKLAWDISDTLNGLMALPNLIALIGLSGVVYKLTAEYKAGLKLNKTK